MAGMVANLSEHDMKGLASFYASQKLKPAAAADKDLAALGQKIWRGGNAASGVPGLRRLPWPPRGQACRASTRGSPVSTPSTSPRN
jgi:hypothetical protein